jgi:hypothetical protein
MPNRATFAKSCLAKVWKSSTSRESKWHWQWTWQPRRIAPATSLDGEKVRREDALDSSERNSRPELVRSTGRSDCLRVGRSLYQLLGVLKIT